MTYLPQKRGEQSAASPAPPALPAPPAQPVEEPILITSDMLVKPARRPSGRVDFEKGMSYAPRLTLFLIVINTVVFAWELSAGALKSKESIIAAGALVRDEVLQGDVWRLFTPMFLHGSPDHLIGNMIVLYILGMALEHAVGFSQMLVLYVVSGLAGGLASMAMNPGPSVGASGAIFGVVAAVTIFLYRHQKRFYVRDKRISIVLFVWAGFTILTGLASPVVDNAAHAGGFLGGVLIGWMLKPVERVPRAPKVPD